MGKAGETKTEVITREDTVLSRRLDEYLRRSHPMLSESVRRETVIVGEVETPLFVMGDDDSRIEFYTYGRCLSYRFLDYTSHIELFPAPEDAVIAFVEKLTDFIGEKQIVLSWQSEELEPCSDLIGNDGVEFYSFLWEFSDTAWVRSWKGTYDKTLKGSPTRRYRQPR